LALSTRIAVNLFVQVETPEDAKIAALTGAHCIVLKGNSSGDDDDDVYLEFYSGKGFHRNYSVYVSYVKHINSSNKA
jgi:hypothetical protein